MDGKTLEALSSAIFVSRCTLNGEAVDTDDKRIRASGLYPEWKEGAHAEGDIYNAEGQTWECYQAYDNATYPDIRPGESAWYTFNRPLHGTSPETARPFIPVQGAHDMYHAGEYMIWTDGSIQRCKYWEKNGRAKEYIESGATVMLTAEVDTAKVADGIPVEEVVKAVGAGVSEAIKTAMEAAKEADGAATVEVTAETEVETTMGTKEE